MKVLVTGAAGFVGRNLVENLRNIRDGKNRTRPALSIAEIYEYTRESTAKSTNTAGTTRKRIWIASARIVISSSTQRV